MSGIEILRSPKTAVLKTAGTNCDPETEYAFNKAGARAEIIQLSQFKNGEYKIENYPIVVIPGGFSYGDDLGAGTMMALELKKYLGDQLMEHLHRGGLILGICNGFQVLVASGLLPCGAICERKDIQASLERNDSGRFISKWVWLKKKDGETFTLPIAHGEGKFVASKETLDEIKKNKQIVLRYHRENPNGSMNAIAGISDPKRQIIGLMPHPERFVEKFHNREVKVGEPSGLVFIREFVDLAR